MPTIKKIEDFWDTYDDQGWYSWYYDAEDREYYIKIRDAIRLSRECLEEIPNWCAEHQREQVGQERGGYVYLLKADNGLYKIGRSKSLDARIKQLGLILPYELELALVIETIDTTKLEQELHDHFADKRKRGEWFELDESDLCYLAEIAETRWEAEFFSIKASQWK